MYGLWNHSSFFINHEFKILQCIECIAMDNLDFAMTSL